MSIDQAERRGQPDLLEPARSAWINASRLKVLLLACLILMSAGWLRLLVGSDGLYDSFGRLLGADFAAFWGAGKAVLAGTPSGPYGLEWFNVHLKQVFGPDMIMLAWNYPPTVLFLVTPLAMLPYGFALALWLGTTYAGLVLAIRGILGAAARQPLFWLAVAAWPGMYGNGLQGQSGFLTAALLGGALICLDRRPLLAGLLLALLAFKPQFGLLIPLALIAGGRWKVIASAASFGAVFFLLSLMAFGWEVWSAFFSGLSETRQILLDQGRVGFHIIQSPYGVLRGYGVPVSVAYGLQIAISLLLAALVWRLWSGGADQRLKCAGLIAASLMATPYCIDYDLVVLVPAIAFCVSYGLEKGFAPWEHTAMAIAFVVPPLARYVSFFLNFPLGLIAAALLFTIVLSKAAPASEPSHKLLKQLFFKKFWIRSAYPSP